MRRSSSRGFLRFHSHAGRVVVAGVLTLLSTAPVPASSGSGALTALKHDVIAQYAAIAHAGYVDALDGARALAAAIDAFTEAPGEESLERARTAWNAARGPYVQTEAFRFYDGPIEAVEGLINSWPIDENLIDYVDGEPDAGVINDPDTYATIDADADRVAQRERRREEHHHRLPRDRVPALGPGSRATTARASARYADYVDGEAPHAEPPARLPAAVGTVCWFSTCAGGRRLGARAPAQLPRALRGDAAGRGAGCILKGVGILSGAELAGERLTVALRNQGPGGRALLLQRQHPPRHRPRRARHRERVPRPLRARRRQRVEGAGVRDLLARVDPRSGRARSAGRSKRAVAAARRRCPPPFDRAILGDRRRRRAAIAVKTLIAALRAQADSIAHAGAALGVEAELLKPCAADAWSTLLLARCHCRRSRRPRRDCARPRGDAVAAATAPSSTTSRNAFSLPARNLRGGAAVVVLRRQLVLQPELGRSRRRRSPRATASARCSTRGRAPAATSRTAAAARPRTGEPMDTHAAAHQRRRRRRARRRRGPTRSTAIRFRGSRVPGVPARRPTCSSATTRSPGTFADGEPYSLRQPTYAIANLGYGPIAAAAADLAARGAGR